jgi:hypothetical protein
MMTPAQFATEIVVPTVREFRENRRSRRHAYLACFAAYHLKDYLKKAGADAEFAMKLHGGSRCFEAVRAVCIAAKHVEFAGRVPNTSLSNPEKITIARRPFGISCSGISQDGAMNMAAEKLHLN